MNWKLFEWKNNSVDTPLNAENMNRIEQGIANLYTELTVERENRESQDGIIRENLGLLQQNLAESLLPKADKSYVDTELKRYLPLIGGTLASTLFFKTETPYLIGLNNRVEIEAVNEEDINDNVGQFSISNSTLNDEYVGHWASMQAKGDDNNTYSIRVSKKGPQYKDSTTVHQLATEDYVCTLIDTTITEAIKPLVTKDYVEELTNKLVAETIDSSPETLNTLKELSDALGNDENFAVNMLNKIEEKASKEEMSEAIKSTGVLKAGTGNSSMQQTNNSVTSEFELVIGDEKFVGNSRYDLSTGKYFGSTANEIKWVNTDGSVISPITIEGSIGSYTLDVTATFNDKHELSTFYVTLLDHTAHIGNYDITVGDTYTATIMPDNTKTTGFMARNFGLKNQVTGYNSSAIGAHNRVGASSAFTVGYNNELPLGANGSIALGSSNTVEGENAYANGIRNTAKGRVAMADGANNNVEGRYARASGYNNKVKGIASFAMGSNNETEQSASIALGISNKAIQTAAIALGEWNTASGLNSLAAGKTSDAKGNYSIALGLENTANGASSLSVGAYNTATGDGSLALCRNNTAEGIYSIAIGSENQAKDNTSIAIGKYNVIAGEASCGIGHSNYTYGIGNFAAGFGNSTYNEYSVSLGKGNTVTKNYGSAVGSENIVSGIAATALGKNNSVSGNVAYAIGQGNTVTGEGGGAFGRYLNSIGKSSIVVGQYNLPKDNAYFIVGNGGGDTTRKNALEVMNDGTVKVYKMPVSENDLTPKKYVDDAVANSLANENATEVGTLDLGTSITFDNTSDTQIPTSKAVSEAIKNAGANAGGSKLYRHTVKISAYYGDYIIYIPFVSTKDTPYQSFREICEYLNGSIVIGHAYYSLAMGNSDGVAKIEFTYTNENSFIAKGYFTCVDMGDADSQEVVIYSDFDDYPDENIMQDTVTEV